MKEALYKFQGLKAGSPEFLPTLEGLMQELKKHMEEEETQDLIALDNSLQSGEGESLAASFKRTKWFIPTRSHPSAPDKPPFETVAGLLAAPIDKLGDLLRTFPDKDTN